MRDPKRIHKFCNELAEIWMMYPDWRFGQLICNVFGHQYKDPFFMEEEEMMEAFKKYFKIGEEKA